MLLIALCYFGVSSSLLKSTSATEIYHCPVGYEQKTANVGDDSDTVVCCPVGTTWVTKKSDGNYYCQETLSNENAASGVGVEISDNGAICQTLVDGFTVSSNDAHCKNNLGDAWSAGSCEFNPLAGTICTCYAPLSECATVAVLATKDFVGGSVLISGKNYVDEVLTAVITDTSPKAEYDYTWYKSLNNDSSKGHGTLIGRNSTYTLKEEDVGYYIWVQVGASLEGYEFKYLEDITDSTNNLSSKVIEKSNQDLIAQPIVNINPTSLSMDLNEEKTFNILLHDDASANSAGTFTISSTDTNVATIDGAKDNELTFHLDLGVSKTIVVKGVAAGTTSININFEPDDSNNYGTDTKKVNITVNDDSDTGGETTPTEYTYNAIFNVGSGATLNGKDTLTCKSTSSSSCTLGSSYSIPTATKSGHTFTGWDIDTSCSSPSKSNLKMTSKTVNYYACFTEDSSSGGNNDEDDDSSSGNNNGGTSVDKDGNVTENSPTGDIIIAVIWFMGIFAVAYAVVNFRNLKEN